MKQTEKVLFLYLIGCFLGITVPCHAIKKHKTVIDPLPNEKWWGGVVGWGSSMPFDNCMELYDLGGENTNSQHVPLMLSSKGRYIWSEHPFAFKTDSGRLILYSDYEPLAPIIAGTALRDAYLSAMEKHFKPSGIIPNPLLFSLPQYETGIELKDNLNQESLLNYAEQILKYDFPAGVLMIEDGWQQRYGNFEFTRDRFPNPTAMIEELHAKGFRIMLRVYPFVSPDSPEFRELQQKGFLVKNKNTHRPAIIAWPNGYSACYDMSHPEAFDHFVRKLRKLQAEYGIDGFQFDAGPVSPDTDSDFLFHDKNATPATMCENWARLGLHFPFNKVHSCWKMGGEALVQRLENNCHSWETLQLLTSNMLSAGLLGYAYTSPDIINAEAYIQSLVANQNQANQELMVRTCQARAMMPMMQFAFAPWRILNEKNLDICRKYAKRHESMGGYILGLAEQSARTGEPITRHMEYAFPHQGFADCKDQFMLGEKYMVAPMLYPGTKRKVMLPKGTWRDDLGKRHQGPKTIDTEVPLNRLPYFERISEK